MSHHERLLQRWRAAGLLDAETAARILTFEHERQGPQRPYLFYALGGLGALSVGIGLLSIVASNWDAISPLIKLASALLLLSSLAVSIELTARRASRAQDEHSVAVWGVDMLVFLFYIATLSCISLVAQIYQLGGKAQHALAYWSVAALPLLLLGRSVPLMAVWLFILQGTWLANAVLLLEQLSPRSHEREVLTCSVVLVTCLAEVALGSWRALQRRRPQLAIVALALGLSQWVLCASAAQQLWYERGWRFEGTRDTAAAGLIAALLMASVVIYLRRRAGERGIALAVLLLLGTLSCYLPCLIPYHGRAGLMGALSFLGLWVLLGWYALRAGSIGLFNLATAVIAVRLLIVYFEVFGSLLNNGLGLLSGGLLTLLLAWVWLRKVRRATPRHSPLPAPAEGGLS